MFDHKKVCNTSSQWEKEREREREGVNIAYPTGSCSQQSPPSSVNWHLEVVFCCQTVITSHQRWAWTCRLAFKAPVTVCGKVGDEPVWPPRPPVAAFRERICTLAGQNFCCNKNTVFSFSTSFFFLAGVSVDLCDVVPAYCFSWKRNTITAEIWGGGLTLGRNQQANKSTSAQLTENISISRKLLWRWPFRFQPVLFRSF